MPDYGDFPGSILGKPVFDKDRRIRDLEDENNWLRDDIAGPLRVALNDARLLLLALIDESDRSDDILTMIARIDDALDMCRTE